LTLQVVRHACHVAVLNTLTGDGALVLPLAGDDVPCPQGGPSLHDAAEVAMLAALDRLGWDVSEDEHGEPWCVDYVLADGREVVGLYGLEPIVSLPSQRQAAQGYADVWAVVLSLI
jgi:hypothetical protein